MYWGGQLLCLKYIFYNMQGVNLVNNLIIKICSNSIRKKESKVKTLKRTQFVALTVIR